MRLSRKRTRAQRHGRHRQQNHERDGEQQSKPRAHFGRIGERPGDGAQRGHHRGRDAELQAARPPARKPAADARRSLLDKPAQHQHRPHRAHIEQRRQTEEQRGQQAGSQPGQRRLPGKPKNARWKVSRLAECRRQRHHHADARGDAQQAAGETEAERLQEKDAQQIGGVRAERP